QGQPLTDEPTLLNFLDALPPRKAMARMHTTAISATRRAYSTRLAPRSLCPNFARRYGAQCCCQYATMSISLPWSTPRRWGLLLSLSTSADRGGSWIGLLAHFGKPHAASPRGTSPGGRSPYARPAVRPGCGRG